MNRFVAIVLVFVLCFTLAACGGGSGSGSAGDAENTAAFEEITHAYFVHAVTSDSITLNYSLAHPENYGVEKMEPTLGSYGDLAFEQEISYCEDLLARLQKINYKKLDGEQRFTYDVLSDYITGADEARKYMYYGDALTPTIGIQTQLPTILGEYHINDKSDFDDYIGILNDLPRYYNEILDFEVLKKDKGTFMAKKTAEDVIKQCSNFVSNPEENVLLTVFQTKIEEYPDLTEEEAAELTERNRAAVFDSVIPAYQSIVDRLTELNADNTREGGLPSIEQGKEYYAVLLKDSVGTNKSPKEVVASMENILGSAVQKIQGIAATNPKALDSLEDPGYPEEETAEAQLDFLKEAIEKDYPLLEDDDYVLKHVDKSLEEDLGPAFYLTPPLDEPDYNVVYLNDKKVKLQAGGIFPVLTHEAYPGHLYQTVYFSRTKPDPVREQMHFGGYTEGWATYVEHRAGEIAGLAAPAPELLSENSKFLLAIYGRVDVGINYEGWSKEETTEYLKGFGIEDADAITEIYDSMVAEPSNYMIYALGGATFGELRADVEKALGDKFDSKEFHRFILETGPAPFYLIEKRMQDWIKTQK
jgi:uncharacterized protein (DUF885 family)